MLSHNSYYGAVLFTLGSFLVVFFHGLLPFFMVFFHGLFSWSFFMVFFLHCLSNSTVKVMKGLPWRIGVAKDHAIKRLKRQRS